MSPLDKEDAGAKKTERRGNFYPAYEKSSRAKNSLHESAARQRKLTLEKIAREKRERINTYLLFAIIPFASVVIVYFWHRAIFHFVTSLF